MSSITNVCQELQSCSMVSLVEPIVLICQLAPSKPDIRVPWTHKLSPRHEPEKEEKSRVENFVSKNNCPIDKSNKNGELGAWNNIQSLTSNSYNSGETTDHPEQVYVHPLVKQSSCSMSTKSLEMCTESLGSETGSNINGGMDEFASLLSIEGQNFTENRRPKMQERTKKMSKNKTFPPPLTSISGSNGIQVRTHREGGRLLIKAINSPSPNINFQTERENGRLRLSLLKEDCRHFNNLSTDKGDEEGAEEILNEADDNRKEETAYETEEQLQENNTGGEGEVDLNGGYWGENGGKIGCKIGGADWSSSRCSKRLPNLHFCVAIS